MKNNVIVGGREPGYSFIAVVEEVDDRGLIQKTRIIDPGVGFNGRMNNEYVIKIGSRISTCQLYLESGYIFYHEGYYLNKNSLLSEIAFLQDNYYYQLNSYEIGSNITPYRYSDILKQNVHPVGYQPFYRYDIIDKVIERVGVGTVPTLGRYQTSGAIDENGTVIDVVQQQGVNRNDQQLTPQSQNTQADFNFRKISSYDNDEILSTDIISTDVQTYYSTDEIEAISIVEPLDFNIYQRDIRPLF